MKVSKLFCVAALIFAASDVAFAADGAVCDTSCAKVVTGSSDAGKSAPAADGTASADAPKTQAQTVVVTYFYTNQRCRTCRRIEELTRKSVEAHFAKEIAAGSVVFRAVNIDDVANEHYATDYQLSFKTVVISDMRGGREMRWTRMDKVWDYVGKPGEFDKYIADGVAAYAGAQ